jgi:hypothetical protein
MLYSSGGASVGYYIIVIRVDTPEAGKTKVQ